MAKYVLHYFDVRARGETIRLALTLAGQPFKDHRVDDEEWEKIKRDMPAGMLPVLEVDGKKMNESVAIAKYLAREYGFAGKTSMEEYRIDRALGAVGDLIEKGLQAYYYEQDLTKKAELQKAIDNEVLPMFLGVFTKYLEEEEDDYFVGKAITLADLAVHDVVTTFLQKNNKCLDKYPKLQAHRKVVESHPKLHEYLAKRPVSEL